MEHGTEPQELELQLSAARAEAKESLRRVGEKLAAFRAEQEARQAHARREEAGVRQALRASAQKERRWMEDAPSAVKRASHCGQF